MHIVMIAAENAALKGGKVGGIGDVIRDVPLALARQGHQVSVITPGYQRLAHVNNSRRLGTINTVFCSQPQALDLYRLETGPDINPLVNHYVLDHPAFAACGAGAIYCHDESAPFATDAHKFALFCTAVCDWLIADELHKPDVIHLHDWHASLITVLRRFHPRYQPLRSIRTVYTIHNLSLQGIRPLRDDYSSLEHWHPELMTTDLWKKNPDINNIVDPRFKDCINLMRCGLLLSDTVHAVSPGYCEEIQRPNDVAKGFIGGEGLEQDLQLLAKKKRLVGILNGCEYPATSAAGRVAGLRDNRKRRDLLQLISDTILLWSGDRDWIPSSYLWAAHRVLQWQLRRKPFPVSVVSIGRLTDQKVSLLRTGLKSASNSECALDEILRALGEGIYILVGTGDHSYEQFFSGMMRKHKNFLYLQGFSEELAEALYGAADLFLMPSSFEPCGISQMLAMRAGTPCVVHGVGGLKNTVFDGATGFVFDGDSIPAQLRNMLDSLDQASQLVQHHPAQWQLIQNNASEARFLWDDAIVNYLKKLYAPS
ncbi:MAG: glycogen/starch synthase [Pseudohongiella sp.]|nr:glycogen/starch synthase [Pseudohongiella sp.]